MIKIEHIKEEYKSTNDVSTHIADADEINEIKCIGCVTQIFEGKDNVDTMTIEYVTDQLPSFRLRERNKEHKIKISGNDTGFENSNKILGIAEYEYSVEHNPMEGVEGPLWNVKLVLWI